MKKVLLAIAILSNYLAFPQHGLDVDIASVESKVFIKNPTLHEEVFGPYSLMVKCNTKDDLGKVIDSLKGQLTVTIMANDADLKNFPFPF